jgi:hypothetical protein
MIENITEVMGEVQNRKIRNQLKGICKYVDQYNNIIPYECLFDPAGKLAIIPDLMRCQIRPIIFFEDGEKVIYIPSNTANLHWDAIKGVADGIKQKAVLKLHYMKTWLTVEVKSESCINWNLVGSKIEVDMSADAYTIVRSKMMEFIKDHTDMKQLMIYIGLLGTGMAFGFLLMGMIQLIYGVIT